MQKNYSYKVPDLLNGTRIGTVSPGKRRLRSNGNEEVTPHSSEM